MKISAIEDAWVDRSEIVVGKPSRRIIFWFLQLVFKNRRLATWTILTVLLSATAASIEPRLYGRIVDQLANAPSRLTTTLFILFGLFTFKNIVVYFQQVGFGLLGSKTVRDISYALFERTLAWPQQKLDVTRVGRLITRVSSDPQAVAEMFSEGVFLIFGNILLFLGSTVGFFLISWRVGLFALLPFYMLVGSLFYFSGRLKKSYEDARVWLSTLNGLLSESLSGISFFQIYRKNTERLESLNQVAYQHYLARSQATLTLAFFLPMVTFVNGISFGLTLWVGANEMAHGRMSAGGLLACLTYLIAIFHPVREIVDRWNGLLSGFASLERIQDTLRVEPEPAQISHRKIQAFNEIKFSDVSFRYPNQTYLALDGVSFGIRAGEKVALVGPSGAGKSTLIALLLKLYPAQAGNISIDGISISEFSPQEIRGQVGYVQQELLLFEGTVEENLRLSEPEKPLTPAVTRAFRELLPHISLEQTVSENGVQFSAGERQALSFLRALQKEPKFWLWDEATSSVDRETENTLERLRIELSPGAACLVIAHRLGSIQNAKHILLLKDGKLIAEGPHEKLLVDSPEYLKLVQNYAEIEAATNGFK